MLYMYIYVTRLIPFSHTLSYPPYNPPFSLSFPFSLLMPIFCFLNKKSPPPFFLGRWVFVCLCACAGYICACMRICVYFACPVRRFFAKEKKFFKNFFFFRLLVFFLVFFLLVFPLFGGFLFACISIFLVLIWGYNRTADNCRRIESRQKEVQKNESRKSWKS